MNELTLEQKQQLDSWVSQRDAILVEIGNLRTEQEKLTLKNKNLAESNTEIQDSINRSKGRLEELDKLEKEYEGITSNELASTLIQKTELETSIADLLKEVGVLVNQKEDLIKTIKELSGISETLSKSLNGIEGNIGKTAEDNSANRREVEQLLEKIKSEVQKLLDVNAENVEKTNVVINELPRIIFDLQRDILERREKFNKTKQS